MYNTRHGSFGCGEEPVVAEAHDVLGRRSAQCDRRVPRAEAHVLGRCDRDRRAHLGAVGEVRFHVGPPQLDHARRVEEEAREHHRALVRAWQRVRDWRLVVGILGLGCRPGAWGVGVRGVGG